MNTAATSDAIWTEDLVRRFGDVQGRLYGLRRHEIQRRVGELVDLIDLGDHLFGRHEAASRPRGRPHP